MAPVYRGPKSVLAGHLPELPGPLLFAAAQLMELPRAGEMGAHPHQLIG